MADGSHQRMNELQFNLALSLYKYPEKTVEEVFVIAGYNISSYWRESDSLKRFRAHLVSNFKAKKNEKVTTLLHSLQHDGAEELLIDAKWMLNEMVTLYEQTKREKKYTQAIRLLDSISMHVDVDSKVSSRLVVEGAIDYAQLLEDASSRLRPALEHEQNKALTISEETVEVEGT